mmetsp:Transcript_6676/g.18736  ORF Transcript_6676/g.18736 Transcript_6676/m.18736 type:complete len:209 (+) Transcript_6676:297-923(+)
MASVRALVLTSGDANWPVTAAAASATSLAWMPAVTSSSLATRVSSFFTIESRTACWSSMVLAALSRPRASACAPEMALSSPSSATRPACASTTSLIDAMASSSRALCCAMMALPLASSMSATAWLPSTYDAPQNMAKTPTSWVSSESIRTSFEMTGTASQMPRGSWYCHLSRPRSLSTESERAAGAAAGARRAALASPAAARLAASIL